MRKTSFFTGFVSVCCCLLSLAAGQTKPTKDVSAKEPPEMSQTDLKQDPQIVSGVLSNGLHYYIRPNAEPKGRISIRLRANVGSLNEQEDERGISHFLEHMVFNGSKNFGIDQVIPTIQKKGLMFGRDVNAFTSFEETVYMIDLPDLKDDTVDMSMTLMRDFADGALFDSKRLDRERGVIINELKTRDSASYRLMIQQLGFLFDGTNLVHRLPIGLEKVIMDTPREKFVEYYTKHYAADQLSFIIVGDITAEKGKELVEKYFGSAKPSGLKSEPDRGVLNVPKEVRAKIIEEKESPMTNLSLSNVYPYIDRPDTIENRLADLPLEIATNMLNRRLSIIAKQEDCPFLQASVYAVDMLHTARQIAINATCEPKNWKKSLHLIEQELRRATEHGFTEREFEEAKQNIIQAADRAVETWATRQSDDLADQLVQSVGDHKVFTSAEEDRAILLPALEKLNVKICSEALVKEWQPDKAQILATGTVEIPGGESELLAVYNESVQTKVDPPAKKEAIVFAYDKVGEPGTIAKKDSIQDLDMVQMTLSNGVKVNYKKTDFESNTIILNARVDGGSITLPKNSPGFAMYASRIVQGGGLEAHNHDQLVQLMAGKNVGVNFSIAEDSFVFSGSTNNKDLETQLKYMCAYLMHAGYHKEPDVMLKRGLPLLYEQLNRESEGVLQINLGRILTGNDARFDFPTQEKLASYTPEDAKAWIDGPLKKNALELNIIGDFDPKTLETLLEQTFAALPARKTERNKPDAKDLEVKFHSLGESEVLTYPTNLDKSLTCVIWKAFDSKDKERRMKLDLLLQVLNIKLFHEIRDKMSDAYSPRAKMESSEYYDGYGYIIALSPGTSENSERVGNAIRELGTTLTKGGISEDDMSRMKTPYLATLEKAQRENSYWLSGALINSQYDADKLDRFRSRVESVRKTTVEDLNALAKEIFPADQSILIRVVPEENKKEDNKGGDNAASAPATVKENLVDEPYAVLVSEETARDPEWNKVVNKLVEAYRGKPFF